MNIKTIIAVLIALIIALAGGYVFSRQSGPSKAEIINTGAVEIIDYKEAHTEHEEDGHGH